MNDKNRFSKLLKHLMTVAKVKNYTLARELQYDESYISKWANGSLLPTEKNHEKILRGISHCIVMSLDEDGWSAMMAEYQLDRRPDLELAVYDNLEAEYLYCVELRESTGSEIAQETAYYPEMTLAQFLSKMRHPVMRQVKSMDVVAAMDILSLDRHYQLSLAMLNGVSNVASRNYPNVHFSLLVNPHEDPRNNTHNTAFLLNLMASLTDIRFQLYFNPRAAGKLVLAVRDAYSISGMIVDENHCMSVTTSEDTRNSNAIYDRVSSMCSMENRAVRKVAMEDMISSNFYAQSMLARNPRWILGHLTEHFVPEDLFEELAATYCADNPRADLQELRQAYTINRNVMRGIELRAMIFDDTLTDFAVSGEINFFNRRMVLTLEQRLKCLEYIGQSLERNPRLSYQFLRNGAIMADPLIPKPTVMLSDSLSHLRLLCTGTWNNISILNTIQVGDMFRRFFDEIWNSPSHVSGINRTGFADQLDYVMQMVRIQLLTD